ncbi:hypothetical protein EON80_09430 [bacterium]|nr:MAG: hypothetical protein EON80_09430 [bacterium]
MKLEDPLSNLVYRCQTMCDPLCCGIDAYDFSPIQIASALTMWEGLPNEKEVEGVRSQLAEIEKRANAGGLTIEEMNQIFTAEQAHELVAEIRANMEIALDLIRQSESLRIRRTSI